jgi:hypothetical protein
LVLIESFTVLSNSLDIEEKSKKEAVGLVEDGLLVSAIVDAGAPDETPTLSIGKVDGLIGVFLILILIVFLIVGGSGGPLGLCGGVFSVCLKKRLISMI